MVVAFVSLLAASAQGCTNLLVTPTASADGSSMVAYNADSAALHGAVSHWKGGSHPPGAMRDVYSWDLGKFLGSIPEADHTYNVMGNANCQGLVIGETTLGGLSELSNVGKDFRNGTILDYGQLIWITLQRAATAREAIDVMADLTAKYGYASDMEGFSITDPSGEVWYMELIGKGGFEKGSLHVAVRVPEGHVIAHANQARITTFLPCDDPSQCKASPDVVSFAIKHGYWKGSPTDPSFSFSDVYDPLTFSGARFCEARVWHIFRSLADPTEFDADYYQPYAAGYNLTRRMPLSVKPKAKLTLDAMHKLMSHHFEGTWFDPSTDIGAGAELSPYRWNGLEWESNGQSYVNERIVGTRKCIQLLRPWIRLAWSPVACCAAPFCLHVSLSLGSSLPCPRCARLRAQITPHGTLWHRSGRRRCQSRWPRCFTGAPTTTVGRPRFQSTAGRVRCILPMTTSTARSVTAAVPPTACRAPSRTSRSSLRGG
jgi:dipeptidase